MRETLWAISWDDRACELAPQNKGVDVDSAAQYARLAGHTSSRPCIDAT